MKTSSQESVRNLFSLPLQEKIYDDFGCAYSDTILYHGRLFLTENFICFNSNILGLKNKHIIPLKDVKDIRKRKILGIFNNSIEIKSCDETKKKQEGHVFTSFASRNIAYKRIKMVWKAYIRANNIKINDDKNSTGGSRALLDSDSNSSEEEAEINLNGINRSSNLSEMNVSVDNDLEGNNSKEEVYFPPVDPEKVFECCKIELKSSTNDIFEKFIKDSADFGWEKFYDELGNLNVTITEWKEIEPNTYIRDLNFLIKVKDVPFITQTRVNKAQKLKKEGDKFVIVGSSTSLDVPYSSYFHIEDTWEFLPLGEKCVLRTTACVNFTKSTFFKSKIETKTREEFKKEVDKWCDYINEKGITYENFIPSPSQKKKSIVLEDEKVLHGVEKSQPNLNQFSPVLNFINKIKIKFLSFCNSNPGDFYVILTLSLIFLLILVIFIKIKNHNDLLLMQVKELQEIKSILMKQMTNDTAGNFISINMKSNDRIKLDL